MNLPSGTVTFLFTDIEGSTRLWEEHPDSMRIALVQHNKLVSDAMAEHDGHVFKTMGDSFCAVFARAEDAAAAAADAQRALADEQWPAGASLRVRMALHTGAADFDPGTKDYFGPALNRVARLLSTGYGGQILLSDITHHLCLDALPHGCTVKPLGEHRLKDLGRPETVFQLCHPDLPADFPPLRSLDNPELPNNLPQQVTSFIGREKELPEVKALLDKTRLLTLSGSGGCGKTRLALQMAADLLDRFPDGVWLVGLGPLSDPGLVPQTAANALDVKEEPGKNLIQTLTDHLKARQLLLVLDNCEHLLDATSRLADAILHSCPHVRILATSREGLGIAGELSYRVPSLSLPDPKQDTTPESLSHYEAARLFVERAQFHQPHFTVTVQNAPAVASVCHRLDGIPLAIELAAARIHAMPVEQIEHRLDQRFRLLTGGSRTALPRQQTLRSLIDWSYDLLTEPEKALLRRLSVFSGGWTLEAAEGVCAGDVVEEWEVVDLLSSLVAKSLVIYEEENGRYRLLETVRQYARDRLTESGESGESEAVRSRHLDWFLAFAEEAASGLFGSEQGAWLDRLEVEHDNLRAALAWSLAHERGGAGLRFGAALWRFWSVRGYLSEGYERLEAALSHPGASAPTAERAKALDGAGLLAMNNGDFVAAAKHYEEALSIGRDLGDSRVIAMACNSLGDTMLYQQAEAARAYYEEALRFGREVDDRWDVAYALTALGRIAGWERDFTTARSLLEEGLAIKRALGDKRSIAYSLHLFADVALAEENRSEARSLYEEGLRIRRDLLDKRWIAVSLASLGALDRAEGEYSSARARFAESAAVFAEIGHTHNVAENIRAAAEMAAAQEHRECAARLYGAAERLRELSGDPLPAAGAAEKDPSVSSLRDALGEEAFRAAWQEGRSMSLKSAIEFALDGPSMRH